MFKELKKPVVELLSPFPEPRRFLLGLSGGPDSRALFHVLRSLQKTDSFSFGVAHIDHGWRSESGAEAFQLKEEADFLGIPFFLHSLKGKKLGGNLEAACREERLRFFSHICRTENYQAVLLAHHQDDLAETVLKRVLEGASLLNLAGMEPKTQIDDLTVLRPWLSVAKAKILEYIRHNDLPFFNDSTNLDPQFLRGRMRTQMIPDLETQFGKSIRSPLARLSYECRELSDFMHKRWAASPWNLPFMDFQEIESLFEARWLVKKWVKNHGLELSSDSLEKIVYLLLQGKAERQFPLQQQRIEVDRKKLFLVPPLKELPDEPLLLKEGAFQWGEWTVEVKKRPFEFREQKGWQAAFLGNLAAPLPEGECYLKKYESQRKWNKKWSDAKTPAFLRPLVPVIVQGNEIVQEFLLENRRENRDFSRVIFLNFLEK